MKKMKSEELGSETAHYSSKDSTPAAQRRHKSCAAWSDTDDNEAVHLRRPVEIDPLLHRRAKSLTPPGLGAILFALIAPTAALAQVAGTEHDFSGDVWSGGELCVVCHTPHDADQTEPQSPLWNHDQTGASFDLYTSPTLVEQPVQPRGPTKLCLSCHDGTVAIDQFGGNSGSSYIGGTGLIGTDLSGTHPVSIEWTHQNDLDGCGNCHDVHSPSTFISELPFFDGYVECATCHDVHNTAPYQHMLRLDTAGSLICRHCHGK